MDVFSIIAQVSSVLGWLLLVYSYYKDDIDKLLFIQIISSIFYCISYLFLGAYSGLLVCFVELLKGIGYYKTDSDNLITLCSYHHKQAEMNKISAEELKNLIDIPPGG